MTSENDEDLPLSRTRKKQQALAITRLAEQLCGLSDSHFTGLRLPPEIMDEARTVRNTSGRGSAKRQMKYLAGLLRETPETVDSLKRQLADIDQVEGRDKKAFHQLEDLRDRLCDPQQFDQACAEVRQLLPHLDMKVITRLAGSVHEHGDKRAYRDIFRRLREEMR